MGWHTLAYSGILWHTLAYSCILWHTLAYSCILWHTLAYSGIFLHTLAYQPTSDPPTTPLFQITPALNTGLSLSEAIMLYKGNHWTQCAGFMDASWVRLGITNDNLGTSWALPGDNFGMTWG